jgi:hypothetical protein
MALITTQPKAVAPAAFEAELTLMDQGIQTNLPAGTLLTINGTAQKQSAIDNTLQGWIATFKAVDTAQAAYKEAVAARVAITVAARTYYKSLKAVIKQYFGAESTLLPSFGITPDKASSTTAQQKLVAAAKRAQTRVVRGTVGKKAKLAITVVGNPPVTVPSTGAQQISPPPVNVGGINTPKASTASSTAASATSSTAAPAATTPAPAGSGSGSNTPGSSTPAGA